MNTRLLFVIPVILLFSIYLPSQEISMTLGKDACGACHASEQKTMVGTSHESGKSCEGCHGAGEQHVKSGGDPETIFSYKRASAFEVRERCGRCHNNPSMRRHATGDVTCVTCHSAHHYVDKKHLLAPQHDPLDHPAGLRAHHRDGTGS